MQRDRKEPWTEASSSSSSSLLLPNPFPLLELVAMIPLPPLECQQSVETERERESNNRFLPGWKSFPGNVVNVNYKRARYKYIFMCVCVCKGLTRRKIVSLSHKGSFPNSVFETIFEKLPSTVICILVEIIFSNEFRTRLLLFQNFQNFLAVREKRRLYIKRGEREKEGRLDR